MRIAVWNDNVVELFDKKSVAANVRDNRERSSAARFPHQTAWHRSAKLPSVVPRRDLMRIRLSAASEGAQRAQAPIGGAASPQTPKPGDGRRLEDRNGSEDKGN